MKLPSQRDSERLDVKTVIAKPLPMPHRLRSNFTFQPSGHPNTIFGENLHTEENAVKVQDDLLEVHHDRISQLAIDYKLHKKNQERV